MSAPSSEARFHLLLVDESGTPVLPEALSSLAPITAPSSHPQFSDGTGGPWVLFVTEDEAGLTVERSLQPLIRLRRSQGPVEIWRAPPGAQDTFLDEKLRGLPVGSAPPTVLVTGQPSHSSSVWELLPQRAEALGALAGRLRLDAPSQYAAYAQKVVARAAPSTEPTDWRVRSLLPSDSAFVQAEQEFLSRWGDAPDAVVVSRRRSANTADLFLSAGRLGRRDPNNAQPVGLQNISSTSGLLWWIHASFALGTQHLGTYLPILSAKAEVSDDPHLSALVTELGAHGGSPGQPSPWFSGALATNEGPLAIFGPADLAWIEPGFEPNLPPAWMEMARNELLAGTSVGLTLRKLRDFFTPDNPSVPEPLRAMVHLAVRSLAILGDPAVSLQTKAAQPGTSPSGTDPRPQRGEHAPAPPRPQRGEHAPARPQRGERAPEPPPRVALNSALYSHASGSSVEEDAYAPVGAFVAPEPVPPGAHVLLMPHGASAAVDALAPLWAHFGTPAVRELPPPGTDLAAWAGALLPREGAPAQVLVVGDFADVSPDLQILLGRAARVGRLPWTDPERLSAYARRAVGGPAVTDGQLIALLSSEGPDAEGISRLWQALDTLIHDDGAAPEGQAEPLILESGPGSLDRLRAAAERPAVVLTATAGVDDAPGALQLGPEEVFTADGLRGAFAPGGAWVMIADASAGSRHRLRIGELIAAALANEAGPLCALAHLDDWRSGLYRPETSPVLPKLPLIAAIGLTRGETAGWAHAQLQETARALLARGESTALISEVEDWLLFGHPMLQVAPTRGTPDAHDRPRPPGDSATAPVAESSDRDASSTPGSAPASGTASPSGAVAEINRGVETQSTGTAPQAASVPVVNRTALPPEGEAAPPSPVASPVSGPTAVLGPPGLSAPASSLVMFANGMPSGRAQPTDDAVELSIDTDVVMVRINRADYWSRNLLPDLKQELDQLKQDPLATGKLLFRAVFNDALPTNRDGRPVDEGAGRTHDAWVLLKQRDQLRLDLVLREEPELYEQRWELMTTERGESLALQRGWSLARFEPGTSVGPAPLRLLVAICDHPELGDPNASNRFLRELTPIDAREQRDKLEPALQRLHGLERVTWLNEPGVPLTLERLRAALNEDHTAVHLFGHGVLMPKRGYRLVLSRGDQKLPFVSPKELSELFGPAVRLVFLSTCNGSAEEPEEPDAELEAVQPEILRQPTRKLGGVARLLCEKIPAVIAAQGDLPEKAAGVFAGAFYDSVLRHGDVARAVTDGRLAVPRVNDDMDSWGLFTFHLSTTDAQLFEPSGAPPSAPFDPRSMMGEGPSADAMRTALEGAGVAGAQIAAMLAGARSADHQPPEELHQDRAQLRSSITSMVSLHAKALERYVAEQDPPLSFDPLVYRQLAAALNAGKHVVLVGPPGTAKTTLAQYVATYAARRGMCAGTVMATATADWTTFDTIGGAVPAPPSGLRFRPGVFLRALARGSWLVLDELNRADLDKAIGELFTLIAGQPVELPQTVAGEPVRLLPAARGDLTGWDAEAKGPADVVVHPGWRILGTMNIYDRASLYSLSFALMRRFAFIEVDVPGPELYRALIDLWSKGLRAIDSDRMARLLGPDTVLMQHRALGPAIAKDMLRYMRERAAEEGAARDEHFAEAILLYACSQLDGLDRDTALGVHAELKALLAPHEAAVLRRLRSLYPGIAPEDWEPKPRRSRGR